MVFLRPMESKWVFKKTFFNWNILLSEMPWVIVPATRMGLYCVSENWDEGGNLAKASLSFTIQPWKTKEISNKNIFFPLYFYQNTYGKIKGQEGGFLTRSVPLAIGPEDPLSHRTWSFPFWWIRWDTAVLGTLGFVLCHQHQCISWGICPCSFLLW